MDNSELANTYGQLQRAFDAFDHCVVLLDVTEEGKWRVLYCNAQLQKLTGRWQLGAWDWGRWAWEGANPTLTHSPYVHPPLLTYRPDA